MWPQCHHLRLVPLLPQGRTLEAGVAEVQLQDELMAGSNLDL
jgi:hypothetical protein